MNNPDFTKFVMQEKGRVFRDFTLHEEIEHHWGRTVTEAEAILFSTSTCNWHPLYVNGEFARAHGHPGVVVNPMLVLCTVVGLSVEDLSESGGPFLGVDDVRFGVPVHPGDTLSARSTVIALRESASRPRMGIVTWETVGVNQRNAEVVRLRRTNLVRKDRAPAETADDRR
ncbi:MaoC family dehydratase [Rhizohabitans arisaemae]|uniref:MaoC family dehydratase n=1 Tax=Rhizohabitans arisaemae TaxID=2720610 RepID=UPI0024B20EF9|nr:MaoC family dehydratase [Rhizohabitans arisaemae]